MPVLVNPTIRSNPPSRHIAYSWRPQRAVHTNLAAHTLTATRRNRTAPAYPGPLPQRRIGPDSVGRRYDCTVQVAVGNSNRFENLGRGDVYWSAVDTGTD